MKVNYVESKGQKTFYRLCGSGNRKAMVYIHGLAGDSRFFHNQMSYFCGSYKVLAPDLPGHGRSPLSCEHTLEFYDRSISEILDREGIEEYILVGHSMGGCISLEHYKNNREKIRGMILVSTAPRLPVNEGIPELPDENFNAFLDSMLSRVFNKKAGIFILAAQKSMSEKDKRVISEDLRLCRSIDCTGQLDSVDVPVLIIANRHDRIVPVELSEDMHRKIKNSKMVIFDDKGHVPFFENSGCFNQTVEQFTSSIQY